MAIFLRYRTFTAALLLLLYAWVAMPVQWWHHHAGDGNYQLAKIYKDRQQAKHKLFTAKTTTGKGTAFADDCPVCAHQYAPHDGFAFLFIVSAPDIHPILPKEYRTFAHSIPADLFSNRGPPAMV